MHKVNIFCLILATNTLIFSQKISNKIFVEHIKSIQIYNNQNILSYPAIDISSSDKIIVEFDDLKADNNRNSFQYTVFHCNSNWEKSNLHFSQYCSGNEYNFIDDIQQCFNTTIFYQHYKISLPNENLRFLKSGNYIFMLFSAYNPIDTIFLIRFYVYENTTQITGRIKRPEDLMLYSTAQQVDLNLKSNFFNFDNINYLKINVLQNNYDISSAYDVKPTFVNQNELIFSNSKQLLFNGGNEFRYFDIQNLKMTNEKVSRIETSDTTIVYLQIEKPRRQYFYYKDINGRFTINNYLGRNASIDADYVIVKLLFDLPYQQEKIYIFGDLSLGTISQQYAFNFDLKIQKYYIHMLLKQGFYNYVLYTNKQNFNSLEGNFYETENTYLVFVYLTDLTDNCDRLIGFGAITK